MQLFLRGHYILQGHYINFKIRVGKWANYLFSILNLLTPVWLTLSTWVLSRLLSGVLEKFPESIDCELETVYGLFISWNTKKHTFEFRTSNKIKFWLNQFGHKRSQHRLDMGGTNFPPPISKYFYKPVINSVRVKVILSQNFILFEFRTCVFWISRDEKP